MRSGIHIQVVFAPCWEEIVSISVQLHKAYRYIDDVLTINNSDFENYLDQMDHADLEIKDTMESNTFASYLDLLLSTG